MGGATRYHPIDLRRISSIIEITFKVSGSFGTSVMFVEVGVFGSVLVSGHYYYASSGFRIIIVDFPVNVKFLFVLSKRHGFRVPGSTVIILVMGPIQTFSEWLGNFHNYAYCGSFAPGEVKRFMTGL